MNINWIDHSAYGHEHATRPHTIGVSMSDSPVGLASWVIEKFYYWTELDRDSQRYNAIEDVYTKDELITNVMLYWITNSMTSAMRLYYEEIHKMDLKNDYFYVNQPVAVAQFQDILNFPRGLVENNFNVQR